MNLEIIEAICLLSTWVVMFYLIWKLEKEFKNG